MEEKSLKGKVYNIQGFSVQDGPGIRTTVFLKGCPLKCPWCHSPESQQFFTEINWMAVKCIGIEKCGHCVEVCPQKCIEPGGKFTVPGKEEEATRIKRDLSRCIGCGACARACIPDALYFCGDDYSVGELADIVEKDREFFETSQGGVTLSGGEPLSQADFSAAFLKECKKRGLNTALDTTGYADKSAVDKVLPYTDLFLYDIKHMDNGKHLSVIGVTNHRIIENIKYIAERGGSLQIRIPVIPGFNDDDENISASLELIKQLGDSVKLVQLLPYHNLGTVKYERVYRNYPMWDTEPPSDEFMSLLKKRFDDAGIPCQIH